ncbi:MAG: hypothetical protein WBF79_00530 [Rhodococcus sp. (in: high G+C Gram-positive bacteria)]
MSVDVVVRERRVVVSSPSDSLLSDSLLSDSSRGEVVRVLDAVVGDSVVDGPEVGGPVVSLGRGVVTGAICHVGDGGTDTVDTVAVTVPVTATPLMGGGDTRSTSASKKPPTAATAIPAAMAAPATHTTIPATSFSRIGDAPFP